MKTGLQPEPNTQYHTSVMLEEAVNALNIKPQGVYVDCTLGGGGHSRAILNQLGPEAKLFVFDQDADAWPNAPQDARCILIKENFRYLKAFLKLHQAEQVDGILADLGVSSYQFDTGERGFSTRYDGPLDMRMDQRAVRTAAQILQEYSEAALHQIFEKYGELRNAKQLAKHIVSHRAGHQINSTQDLKALIAPIVKGKENRYYAQLFQALRIEVNEEFAALKDLLEQALVCLKPGGRLAIISFHSLEDRLVKQFIKWGSWTPNEDLDPLGLQASKPSPFLEISKKPIEASSHEIQLNPRARSARLRIAEKK